MGKRGAGIDIFSFYYEDSSSSACVLRFSVSTRLLFRFWRYYPLERKKKKKVWGREAFSFFKAYFGEAHINVTWVLMFS